MADGEDWLPGADLQATRKELWEVKDWLTAVQQKESAPLSLHVKTPTAQEPTDVLKSPRGEVDAGNEGDKVREEAVMDKAASPPRSVKKRASKVSEADQVEHVLAGGQWEGLGGFVRAVKSASRCVRDGWENSDTDVMHRAD